MYIKTIAVQRSKMYLIMNVIGFSALKYRFLLSFFKAAYSKSRKLQKMRSMRQHIKTFYLTKESRIILSRKFDYNFRIKIGWMKWERWKDWLYCYPIGSFITSLKMSCIRRRLNDFRRILINYFSYIHVIKFGYIQHKKEGKAKWEKEITLQTIWSVLPVIFSFYFYLFLIKFKSFSAFNLQ